MAFTGDTQRLVDDLRAATLAITDQRARRLVEAWVRAWDTLSTEYDAAVTELLTLTPGSWPSRQAIARADRTRIALERTLARLDELANTARVTIAQDAAIAAMLGADSQTAIVASQLPPTAAMTINFGRAATSALDAIVTRATENITAATAPLPDVVLERIRASLIRGVAVGENPRTTATAMLKGLEREFNGGLTRALTISRTEVLDAMRAGSKAAHDASPDVVTGWKWLAELSRRTCPACLALNGSVHPASEAGPEGHQNCRCARVPITPSWKDLGFDIPEPADTFPDARAWFDQQSPAVQAQVMGPGRLAALRSGAASWDDLATRRTTLGWRDSWHPTPVAALA